MQVLEQWPKMTHSCGCPKCQTTVALARRSFRRSTRFRLLAAAPVPGLGVVQCHFVPRDPTLQVFEKATDQSHVPNRDYGLAGESRASPKSAISL